MADIQLSVRNTQRFGRHIGWAGQNYILLGSRGKLDQFGTLSWDTLNIVTVADTLDIETAADTLNVLTAADTLALN